MEYTLMLKAFPMLLKAAITTMEISFITFVLGFAWGIVLAIAKLSKVRLISLAARAYIGAFRGFPLLVLLFAVYFGFPQLGWNIGPFTAGIIALTLNLGAFIAEIVRAGILSVDPGQLEAGLALGYTQGKALWDIILPQALRTMIAPLSNEYINAIKDSSLVSTITILELTLTAQRIVSSTFRPLELYLLSGLIYLVLTLIVEKLARYLENLYSWGEK